MPAQGLSLDAWLAQIEAYSPQEIDLGLDRVTTLLQRLDLVLPQTVFHVAGTNGKGSSVAMLESLLRTTGARVGSYTSPHLLRYNERMRLGGVAATDAQIIAAFERIESVRNDVPLTYFEFGTLAAMLVFTRTDIEIAVLEVGMGGRLDAVNAIEPTAGLITNVSLDHCAWLGDDIETVAGEKAGIMRAIKPVIFAARDLPAAITEHADAAGSRLIAAGRDYQWSIDGDRWSWRGVNHELHDLARPSVPGDMQIQNAAGVLALLEAAGFDTLLKADVIDGAFGNLHLAGRMQSVGEHWLLDVAHNPAASDALADAMRVRNVAGSMSVILGMLDDKDVEGFVAPLSGVVDQWIAVTAGSPRAVPAGELARRVANATNCPCLISNCLPDAIEYARDGASPDDRILVTGSFYVVGAALELLERPKGRSNSLYSRGKGTLMDRALKERIIGAIILVLFVVLVVPVFLDGRASDGEMISEHVPLPGQSGEQYRTVVLNRDRTEPVPAAVADNGSMQAGKVSADVKREPASAPIVAATSPTGMWAVQLGSFSKRENAERLAAELKELKFAAFLSQSPTESGGLHRVRIGPLKDRESADAMAGRLQKAGHKGQVVPVL